MSAGPEEEYSDDNLYEDEEPQEQSGGRPLIIGLIVLSLGLGGLLVYLLMAGDREQKTDNSLQKAESREAQSAAGPEALAASMEPAPELAAVEKPAIEESPEAPADTEPGPPEEEGPSDTTSVPTGTQNEAAEPAAEEVPVEGPAAEAPADPAPAEETAAEEGEAEETELPVAAAEGARFSA